jgi:hypothetical protein
MMKHLSFHNSSFALRYFLLEMARPQCDTCIVFKNALAFVEDRFCLIMCPLENSGKNIASALHSS